MERTEHIGLHQWKGTDQFLREEFNEDFRRIDGAVGGLLRSEVLVPLLRTVVTVGASAVELDLSGIDLSQYRELRIGTWNFSTVQTCTVCAVLNGDRTDGNYVSCSTDGLNYVGKSIVLSRATYQGRPGGWEATVFLSPEGVFMESRGLTAGIGENCGYEQKFGCTTAASAVTGKNLTTLTLEVSPYGFASGEVSIYGVKK